jgi:hypothetical protein
MSLLDIVRTIGALGQWPVKQVSGLVETPKSGLGRVSSAQVEVGAVLMHAQLLSLLQGASGQCLYISQGLP